MDLTDPSDVGRWLAARAKYGPDVKRADAVCWFVSRVGGVATAQECKVFATAFRGKGGRKYNPKTKEYVDTVEPLSSLFNACYGGVAENVSGDLSGRYEFATQNYDPVAPFWRVRKATYALTVGGMRRAARVQAFLDGLP